MSKKKALYDFINSISPAELSKIRGKRQDTSTRDKKGLLSKITEIENILEKMNVEIFFKKK